MNDDYRDKIRSLIIEQRIIDEKMLHETLHPPTNPTTGSGVILDSGYLTLDEYDSGLTDPMDEVDFGNRYVVYVSEVSVAKEPEFCRHAIMAPSNYEAAANAVRECRLTVYGTTVVAEVFPHTGTEHRFSYQLTYHA